VTAIPPPKVATLNDQLRQTHTGGHVLISVGLSGLGQITVLVALRAIAAFSDFDDANDPFGEHDFGVVEAAGQSIMFKIDYYNQALSGGSDAPDDPTRTIRIMTVMLAHEY